MSSEKTGNTSNSLFGRSVEGFLAPVVEYLHDDTVSEVLINGPNEVFIERKGVLERVSATFGDEQALQAAVRNIAQFVGRRINDKEPILDARLPDGSRVAAVIPPCSRRGTTLSIRKFSKGTPTFIDLIKRGSITEDAARFMDVCMYLARNVLISGGTGSGKTTILNILGTRIPPKERIIIVEDSSELKIKADHVVFFETREADEMGEGKITIRDLVKSALRLRPDRIVVGEVRGPEALDLITAMNTGHGGSMGTTHANSPYDGLVRLETLSLMGDVNVPIVALRRQISSAINIVLQAKRFSDGTRKITNIAEVLPEVDEAGRYQLQDIYRFVQRGRAPDGKIIGEMVPTGVIPTFMHEIEVNRIPFPREKFKAPDWAIPILESEKKAA